MVPDWNAITSGYSASEDPRGIVVDAFARTVHLLESRVPEFRSHSARVASLSASIAKQLGLPPSRIEDIRVAGLLHDIGMLAVPDEYVTRPGRLERREFEKIRAHPRIGADLVRRFRFLQYPAVCIAFHHERWDGTGYPRGLAKKDIPLGARVVGIAEVYAALVESRGHRDPMSPAEAMDTLTGAEGVWFDHRTLLALTDALDHQHRGQQGSPQLTKGALRHP